MFAGVDVGGTGIKSVLMTGGGRIVGEDRAATPSPGPGIADRVADAVRDSVARLRLRSPRPLGAVGFAVPGTVDEGAGIAIYSENLGWRDAPMREMVAERVALPTAFGHDVRLGALAEARLGAGRGRASTVFIAIGTGIAAALCLDGRPYSAHGYAGEIGHTDVGHGEPCACGGTGCLEAIASAAAIARRYTARTGQSVRGSADVLALAAQGDPIAAAVWNDALDALGRAVAWIASVLAPDAVLLGGGLAEAGDALITPLADRLDPRLTFQYRPQLLRAALGDRAASLGSALIARDLLSACGVP
jgi:glucokinase